MGLTLIDTKTIHGAYIDRKKNRVENIKCKSNKIEKIIYHRPLPEFEKVYSR